MLTTAPAEKHLTEPAAQRLLPAAAQPWVELGAEHPLLCEQLQVFCRKVAASAHVELSIVGRSTPSLDQWSG